MSRKNPREIDKVIARLLSVEHGELKPQSSADEQEEVLASDAVRFVARLHLLSTGDARQGNIIEEPTRLNLDGHTSAQIITARVDVPISVHEFMSGWKRTDSPATINATDGIELDTNNPDAARFIRCTVRVDCGKVLNLLDIPFALADSLMKKRVFAAGMLATIAASFAASGFTTNRKTLALQRSSTNNIVAIFIDDVIDGKVTACPICGNPVFLPRLNESTPFCRKSHYIRYNEQAKRLYGKGASIDEVLAAFPHIGRETVANW